MAKAKKQQQPGFKQPQQPAATARHNFISKKEKRKQKKQLQEERTADRAASSFGSGSTYRANALTLLLGEGDFSFAAALALTWGDASNLVATSFDDEESARAKYTQLAENVETITSLGGNVLFGVDATRCHMHKTLKKGAGSFDRVVFNFPHVGSGIKDMARSVTQNQELLRGTFRAALPLLGAGGEVHITLKKGEPYDSWNVVAIAKMCGLCVGHCTVFAPGKYPGYAHRRSIGDEHAGDSFAAESGSARTYAFVSASEREAAREAAAAAGSKPGAAKGPKGNTRHKAIYKAGPRGVRKM
jgi:25S rRNA (uracil2634-N3)-methyltransferase